MAKGIYLVLAILLLASFICAQFISAQESAQFNFGTAQRDKLVVIEPGKTAETEIYFYNIFGNRATHVTLDIVEKPEGWDIKIEPALHNITLNVTGVITTTQENLYAVPCKVDESWCPTNDTTPREGVKYIGGSGVEGRIPAKIVTVTITAPEGLPLWKNYPLTITATAQWFGEAGMVALTQQRDFSYTLRTITKEYSEGVIEEEQGKLAMLLSNNWPFIVIALLILLVVFLVKKRKKR